MDINEADIERLKEWLEFTNKDVEHLEELDEIAKGYADELIQSLNEHFKKFDESSQIFDNPEVLKRVKILQKEYFLRLTQGNYDNKYIEERLNIGSVHASIGLDVKWCLGAYNFYIQLVGDKIFEAFKDNPEKTKDLFLSLIKLIFMDIGLAIDTYIYEREITIHNQRKILNELSTPVLQVRDELLILPIVGAIDEQRARLLTETLLKCIRDKRSKVVVMDITGVPTVDSRVANHLLQTVDASRLMGATVIVTGLSPEVAQTLVTIGVNLNKLNTVGDLQGGLAVAEKLLGYTVTREINPKTGL
ncbi:MAG: STAS domain-containing protein [Legionella sp.]|nr:STAS domain-containing protein [Legionella sp.]